MTIIKKPSFITLFIAGVLSIAANASVGVFSGLFNSPTEDDMERWVSSPWRYYVAAGLGFDSISPKYSEWKKIGAKVGDVYVHTDRYELFGAARSPVPVLVFGYGAAFGAVEFSYRHNSFAPKDSRPNVIHQNSYGSWAGNPNDRIDLSTSGSTDVATLQYKIIYPQFLSRIMGGGMTGGALNIIGYNAAFGVGTAYSATRLKYSGDVNQVDGYSSAGALLSFGLDVRMTQDVVLYYEIQLSVFGKDSFSENLLGLRYYF